MKLLFSLLLTLIVFETTAVEAQELVGVVTHVRDGDTIEVSGVPIRLNGLNCDEKGSRLGNKATAVMKDLVRGKRLMCNLNGEVTYDRRVGRCFLPDGRDIGAILIEAGLCSRCDRYDPQGAYIEPQRKAGRYRGKFPSYCKPR